MGNLFSALGSDSNQVKSLVPNTNTQQKVDQSSKSTSEDVQQTSKISMGSTSQEDHFYLKKFDEIDVEKLNSDQKIIYKKLSDFFDKHKLNKNEIPFEYMLQFSSKERIEKELFSHLSEEEDITFKIILSTLEPLPFLFKPVVNFFSKKAKYGRIHTALQVGSHVVEWFDSSLVHIKQFQKSSAVFAFDLCIMKEEKLKNTVENRQLMIEAIYKWNVQKTYSLFQNNCQGFVDDLFKDIKYEAKYPKLVEDYFKAILESDENAKPHYVKDGKIVFFKNHEEFDGWYKDQKFKINSDEYNYYKSFDRSFWINGDLVEECCFGNPTGI